MQLCKKEFKPSSNFLRHVAKDHLKISLYQCPICKSHGGQDAYEIRSHMQKLHGGCTQEPVSNIEEHADEIQKMYQKCFPGRRLKVNISECGKLTRITRIFNFSNTIKLSKSFEILIQFSLRTCGQRRKRVKMGRLAKDSKFNVANVAKK